MQYKGLKMIKRVAAVIVSAAIMLADLQGVSAAEVERAFRAETMEAETQDDSAQTGMDEGLPVEDFDAETQTVAPVETIQAEAHDAAPMEITETVATQIETIETSEAESTQDTVGETQVETPETKIEEAEQIVSEVEEPTDASEVAVEDEIVSDDAKTMQFMVYGDKEEQRITKTAISVNDPVTIVAVFDENIKLPLGAKVQWDSNKPTYVKTVQTDTAGVVNAIKLEGLKPTEPDETVKVTCVIYDGDNVILRGVLNVTVNPLVAKVAIKISDYAEDASGKEIIYSYQMENGENRFISIGSTVLPEVIQKSDCFSASVEPSNANPKVTWKSSNPSIISFTNEDSGKIEVRGVGEATITATATDGSNISGSVKVKVRRLIEDFSFKVKPAKGEEYEYIDGETIDIAVGTSISITPEYDPGDATVRRLSWSNKSDDKLDIVANESTNVLTVRAKSGTSGPATLTATTTDMSGIEKTLHFNITPKVESLKIYAVNDATKESTDVTGKSLGYDPTTYDAAQPNNVYIFEAHALPTYASQTVDWKISNSKIATVEKTEDNKYKVTISPEMTGTAVITATATDGSNISATVTLKVGALATGVEISGSQVVMRGRTIKLTASVIPKSVGNVKFKWESYNPAIASVNEITGEVTGKAVGIATILATAQDGSGKSSEYTIRVTDPPKDFDIVDPAVPDENNNNANVITGKTLGLDPDDTQRDTKTIEIKILPETASQRVEWKSSNEKVISIAEVDNSNGKQLTIKAKAIGTATITANALDGSGKTASIKVNVNTLATGVKITGGQYVAKEMTLQLKAEVTNADAANKSVIWKSDAPKIAEVNEHGLVTAVGKDGMARITAEAADGSGKKDVHNVYVVSKPNKVTIIGTGINVDKKTLDFGLSESDKDTVELEALLSGGYAERDGIAREIKWSTSSKSIATVEANAVDSSKAQVKIYKKGTVKITATTTEGFESSSTVTINVKSVKPQVTITGQGTRLARGKKMKLSVGSVPVEWASDSPDIAKVSKTGQVTADKYADGNVIITAEAVEGGSTATFPIYIGEPVSSIDLTLNGKPIENLKEKIGVDIINGCINNQYGGDGIRLGATLNYEEEAPDLDSSNVTWKSSNKSVATVDGNGVVTLKKKGNVTFTATATDGTNKKAKVTFVVSKQMTKMYPVGCEVGEIKEIRIGLKKSIQLNTQIAYKPLAATKPKLVWTIADDSDAVSVGKNNGKVTGKIEGDSALIKATDANNANIYCYFRVSVYDPVNKVEIIKKADSSGKYDYQSVVGIDLSEGNEQTISLVANLYAKYDDEDAPTLGSNETTAVIWSSSNKAIASVDENGVVTAHKNGQVTITATATDGSKKKGKVKVYCGKLVSDIILAPSIGRGITLELGKKTQKTCTLADKLTVKPVTATNRKLSYASTDKTVVTVSASGKVTAKGEGPADIIVTSKDGGCSITIPVYVYDSSEE